MAENGVRYSGTAFMKSDWKLTDELPFFVAVEAPGWSHGFVEGKRLKRGRNDDVVATLDFSRAKRIIEKNSPGGISATFGKSPMNHWIFQGNPDQFNLVDYVRDHDFINWTVRQKNFVGQMKVGDEVYIWQAAGKASAPSGIIASANIMTEPAELPEDPGALKYWHNPALLKPEMRVRLRIKRRCVENNEIVRREWIKNDPTLQKLVILRFSQNTNYKILESEAQRLAQLILETGSASSIPVRQSYKGYGEAPNDDPAALQESARKVRKGQGKFRAKLLKLYGGRCAISGWAPEEVLEASHISEHASSGINHSDNGILLRSDFHHLLDANLLKIDPENCVLLLDLSLKETPYWQYQGLPLPKRSNGSQIGRKYMVERFGCAGSQTAPSEEGSIPA